VNDFPWKRGNFISTPKVPPAILLSTPKLPSDILMMMMTMMIMIIRCKMGSFEVLNYRLLSLCDPSAIRLFELLNYHLHPPCQTLLCCKISSCWLSSCNGNKREAYRRGYPYNTRDRSPGEG
jgi:hypothetical protein